LTLGGRSEAILRTAASELRQAVRRLRRRPGLAGGAVLTLAVAIGASTAVFSVVDAVLLRPLPFPEPDRLAFLTREGDVSIPDGEDWRASSRAFEDVALFLRRWNLDLTGSGDPERVFAAVVEARYFRILPMAPLVGRAIRPADDAPGAVPVAVLAEPFWKRRFGGDPRVVGHTVVLSGRPTLVVGVMPAQYDFLGDEVDLWAPVATTVPWALAERGTNNFDALGRLRAKVTLDEARAEMVAITTRLAGQYPRTNRGKIIEPRSMSAFVAGPVRPALLTLLGAVLVVTLAASASVAALLLARHARRGGELGVRLSLGASPFRLVGHVLAESVVLSGSAAALGTALAAWGRDVLLALAPASLPRASRAALDLRVLLFAAALAAAAAVLAAVLPAALAARTAPSALLGGSARGIAAGRGAARALQAVIVAEVALAAVLLVGATLLVRSFVRLQSVPLGFEPHGVLTAEVVLPESRYGSRAPQTRAVRTILDHLASTPGVVAAAWVTTPPLEARGGIGGAMLVEGREAADSPPTARVRFVAGDYFGAAGIPIVRGHGLGPEDDTGPPVAVVNERFAGRYLADGAVGRRIAFRDFGGDDGPYWMTVVGVVSDIRARTLAAPDEECVFAPFRQRRIEWNRWGTVVARGKGDPAALVPSVRDAVRAADPDVPLQDVATLGERVARAAAPQRFNARLVAAFGLVALGLAVQGLYGLVAFAAEARRREIGLRLSLGATAADVVRLVGARGLRPVAVGLAIGLPAGHALARAAASVLYGVSAWDPVTYAVAAATLGLAAAAAALVPARRASRLDPAAILREA
jgi:putative ABC transport system permease protein